MLLGLPISVFDTSCSRLGLFVQSGTCRRVTLSSWPGMVRLLSQGCVMWLWILGNFGANEASHIGG